MNIKIHKLDSGLPDIKPMCYGDAGFDLFSKNTVVLNPWKYYTIPLGIAIELPTGYEAEIRGRSGLASKYGLMVHDGTIDSGYRGELMCIAFNASDEALLIERGDRICQMIIHKVEIPEIKYVDSLSSSERGETGFGSTGI